MMLAISSVVSFFALADAALAFQTTTISRGNHDYSTIMSSKPEKGLQSTHYFLGRGRRSLLAAIQGNIDEGQEDSVRIDTTTPNNNNDIDGRRRRQLLFSMLYGSATVLTTTTASSTNAATTTEGIDNILEAGIGTDVLLGSSNDNQDSSLQIIKEATTTTHILKPPKDDRDYLAYTLENGLKVLLCSDPSSNEAAACMDVHVGACSDPIEVPGMAHFTGTKKSCFSFEYVQYRTV